MASILLRPLVLVALLGGIVLGVGVGEPAFLDFDEAIYAKVMDETAASGHLATLQLLGGGWFEKPPLYFWAGMAFRTLIPDAELAYRLPSVLAGIVSLILVYLIAQHISGSWRAGLLSALVLLTCAIYVEAARDVRPDVPVSAAILFAFYAYLRGRKDSRWYALVGVGIALAVMVKSVVAVLALVPILLWSLFTSRLSWMRAKSTWVGAALFLALVVPWHAYEHAVAGPVFWSEYLGKHVVGRVGSNLLASDATNALYVESFLRDAFPWSFVFLALFAGVLFMRRRFAPSELGPLLVLAFTAFGFFALFLAPATKSIHYLIPVYPFVALFIGLAGAGLIRRHPRAGLVLTSLLLAAGLAQTLSIGYRNDERFGFAADLANEGREAGKAIAAGSADIPAYSLIPTYGLTVRYYSGRWDLQDAASFEAVTAPALVVAPAVPLLPGTEAPLPPVGSELIYDGDLLQVYRIPEPAIIE